MKKVQRSYWIIGTIFVLFLFSFITKQTPLAGDDWGYALNGMTENAFVRAVDYYFNWSGRFFSELWGLLVAPNKWIWDALNPIFFAVIFACSYWLVKPKKNHLLVVFAILAVMLSVDDNLRMETYSWLMGTTIVIPLALSLIYFVIINRMDENLIGKLEERLWLALSSLLLFYIGLAYENIAAGMIVAVITLIIYNYFYNHISKRFLFINLFFSVGSFVIMRLSPGSSLRLLRDHAGWNSLNLFEKIADGYPKFIEFTFLNNNYLIMLFSLAMILLIIFKRKRVKCKYELSITISSIIVNLSAIVTVFAFVLPEIEFLTDRSSLFNTIFWIIYVVMALVTMFVYLDINKEKTIFYFLIAGTCNLVMIYSPIFGSRNALYTVFFIAICIGLIISEIELPLWVRGLTLLVLIVITADRTTEYINKYTKVHEIHLERMGEIDYYRHNSELKEGWITRMPPFTVHSADVEPDNTYHMETFKDYYGINPKMIINFGWKESYD